MIDTHCHLTDPRLHEQLEAVIERARAAGVTKLITIGTDIEDDRAAVAVCHDAVGQLRPDVRCVVGVHPNYTQDATLDDVPQLREIQRDPAVVALGEMGLDYFHKFADRGHQARMFEAQLAIAAEVGRPVVIHSREAIADTLGIMKNFPTVPAVFHCFTGTMAEAEAILAAGERYRISFTGPITYKKNDALRDVVERVPLDRLMVETDAPYLSPEPKRAQKVCEPAFVIYTAAMVAEVKGVGLDEVDRVTTEVARGFFGWG
ncbi:MAG TPA: TatD family hydrolase [Tepidisphaeraceae bacterium]|nr:TatD family hydrolase [Tepidisphaeraceae bacterium]